MASTRWSENPWIWRISFKHIVDTSAPMVKERPILFKAEMVRAILEGRKTQTRLVMAHPHITDADRFAFDAERGEWELGECHQGPTAHVGWLRCPFGKPSDRLWVKESWAPHPETQEDGCIYRATDPGWDDNDCGVRWRPSIHMPRELCRLVLEVTDVRVEKLQSISEEDAKAEGVEMANGHPVLGALIGAGPSHREGFAQIWRSIYG